MRYIMLTILWSIPAIVLFCGSAYLVATSVWVPAIALVAAPFAAYGMGMLTRAIVRR